MVIIDIVINTLLDRLTLHPAGMHCPSWDDAFVSSFFCSFSCLIYVESTVHVVVNFKVFVFYDTVMSAFCVVLTQRPLH